MNSAYLFTSLSTLRKLTYFLFIIFLMSTMTPSIFYNISFSSSFSLSKAPPYETGRRIYSLSFLFSLARVSHLDSVACRVCSISFHLLISSDIFLLLLPRGLLRLLFLILLIKLRGREIEREPGRYVVSGDISICESAR